MIRPLESEKYVVYSAISECDKQVNMAWIDKLTHNKIELTLNPRRAALFILEKVTGNLVAAYLNGFLKVGVCSLRSEKGTIAVTNLNKTPVLMAGDRAENFSIPGLFITKSDDGIKTNYNGMETEFSISNANLFRPIKLNTITANKTTNKKENATII